MKMMKQNILIQVEGIENIGNPQCLYNCRNLKTRGHYTLSSYIGERGHLLNVKVTLLLLFGELHVIVKKHPKT